MWFKFLHCILIHINIGGYPVSLMCYRNNLVYNFEIYLINIIVNREEYNLFPNILWLHGGILLRFKRQSQIILVLILVVLTVGLVISPSKTRNKVWSPIEPVSLAESASRTIIDSHQLFISLPKIHIFGVEMEKIKPFYGLIPIVATDAGWVRRNALLWSDVKLNEGSL